MRNINGKCKSSRKIDSNLLWLVIIHYSDDAAEALTSQAPDGKSAVHASSLHTRARAKWASMRRFLVRDAADPKSMATIYRKVVLYVLLYGSKSWVMTSDLMRQLRSFHRRCCRGLTGEFIRQDEEGEWICPTSEEVLIKAGVLTIEEYIQRRRDTIMKYAETRNKYGKCKSSRKIFSFTNKIVTFDLLLCSAWHSRSTYSSVPRGGPPKVYLVEIRSQLIEEWKRRKINNSISFSSTSKVVTFNVPLNSGCRSRDTYSHEPPGGPPKVWSKYNVYLSRNGRDNKINSKSVFIHKQNRNFLSTAPFWCLPL